MSSEIERSRRQHDKETPDEVNAVRDTRSVRTKKAHDHRWYEKERSIRNLDSKQKNNFTFRCYSNYKLFEVYRIEKLGYVRHHLVVTLAPVDLRRARLKKSAHNYSNQRFFFSSQSK